jgi:hypothetical protein
MCSMSPGAILARARHTTEKTSAESSSGLGRNLRERVAHSIDQLIEGDNVASIASSCEIGQRQLHPSGGSRASQSGDSVIGHRVTRSIQQRSDGGGQERFQGASAPPRRGKSVERSRGRYLWRMVYQKPNRPGSAGLTKKARQHIDFADRLLTPSGGTFGSGRNRSPRKTESSVVSDDRYIGVGNDFFGLLDPTVLHKLRMTERNRPK